MQQNSSSKVRAASNDTRIEIRTHFISDNTYTKRGPIKNALFKMLEGQYQSVKTHRIKFDKSSHLTF